MICYQEPFKLSELQE